jgi:hypothetical protein
VKKQVAAALSIAGVLVTGSAAAMVNSQVLQSNPPTASAAAATTSTPASTPTLGAELVGMTATTVPTTTQPVDTSTTVASAPAAGLAVYQVGDAGTVTLDASGDELVVVSAVANPGWTTSEVRHDGDDLTVKVEFVSATTKVEFRANLLFGVVSTSVESENLAAGQTGSGSTYDGGSPSTTVAGYDDGYGDEHEDDDEHESDDHSGSGSESEVDDDD